MTPFQWLFLISQQVFGYQKHVLETLSLQGFFESIFLPKISEDLFFSWRKKKNERGVKRNKEQTKNPLNYQYLSLGHSTGQVITVARINTQVFETVRIFRLYFYSYFSQQIRAYSWKDLSISRTAEVIHENMAVDEKHNGWWWVQKGRRRGGRSPNMRKIMETHFCRRITRDRCDEMWQKLVPTQLT